MVFVALSRLIGKADLSRRVPVVVVFLIRHISLSVLIVNQAEHDAHSAFFVQLPTDFSVALLSLPSGKRISVGER
jgi:hypothetical protein